MGRAGLPSALRRALLARARPAVPGTAVAFVPLTRSLSSQVIPSRKGAKDARRDGVSGLDVAPQHAGAPAAGKDPGTVLLKTLETYGRMLAYQGLPALRVERPADAAALKWAGVERGGKGASGDVAALDQATEASAPRGPRDDGAFDVEAAVGRPLFEAGAESGGAGGSPAPAAPEGAQAARRKRLPPSQLASTLSSTRGGPRGASAAARPRRPGAREPPVLATMRWHEPLMDQSPAGTALRAAWRRQVLLETRAVEAAAARYRRDAWSAVQRGDGAALPSSRRLLLRWFAPLVEAVRAEQEAVAARLPGLDRGVYGPYLLLLSPEQLAVITMHSVINSVMEVGESAPQPNSERGGGDATGADAATGAGPTRPGDTFDPAGAGPAAALEPLSEPTEAGDLVDPEAASAGAPGPPSASPKGVGPAGAVRMTRLALSIGRAVEAQVGLERLQVLCARANRRNREAAALRAEGGQLRERLLAEGDLDADAWARWRAIGEALAERGELLPLDPLTWFAPAEGVETRLARLSLPTIAKAGDVSRAAGGVLSQVRKVGGDDATLGDPWGVDVVAKVGVALAKLLVDTATVDVPRNRVGGAGGAAAADGDGPAGGRPAGAAALHPSPLLDELAAQDAARGRRSEPAFWHHLELMPDPNRRSVWKKYGLFFSHDEVLRRVRPAQMAEAFVPTYTPMLLPPVPWQRADVGAHLTLRCSVMRTRGSHLQLEHLRAADEARDSGRGPGLSQVYDALNALGETPWAVHPGVLRVVEAIWAGGGGVADLPRRANVLPPDVVRAGFGSRRTGRHDGSRDDGAEDAPGAAGAGARHGPRRSASGITRAGGHDLLVFDTGREAERASRRARRLARRRNAEAHSLRCDAEYKLAVAREFGGEPAFYYPHNLDFRGRAYPLHPHLNHLGSDLCRGLLTFAEARPLGPSGLRWLYVQAANLWGSGVDKLPHDGRVAWAEENIEALRKNARDPLAIAALVAAGGPASPDSPGGSVGAEVATPSAADAVRSLRAEAEAFRAAKAGGGGRAAPEYPWHVAEAPFQFLATCIEIDRALASGDPASHESRLPVHMDGSCNGLQHYAALGRDEVGGRAVNLADSERPQDVYTEVAQRVRARVERDAAGSKVPHAKALLEATSVDRKLVKQTVMTSVYGVTFIGARAQIGDRLRERGLADTPQLYKVSCYAATVTLEALHEMFSGAKDIMRWLAECARVVAKSGDTVRWTTPLGLPVVQPYRRSDRHHVRTLLQRLVVVDNNDTLPVMKQRQRTAFPPNFIHSIDSSHMMMTASACRKEGLAFAGVHDSYWTHAGDVERMNEILRDQFVALHSRPLLEDLLAELRANHPGLDFPPVPDRGNLDLELVKGSTYFFS